MLCSPAAGGAVAAARSSPSALQTVSPPKGAPRWTGNCWSCSLSAGRESQTHEPSLRTEQNLLARQPSAGSNTRNAAVNCRGKQEALGQVGPWIHSSRHGMGAQSRSRCRRAGAILQQPYKLVQHHTSQAAACLSALCKCNNDWEARTGRPASCHQASAVESSAPFAVDMPATRSSVNSAVQITRTVCHQHVLCQLTMQQ